MIQSGLAIHSGRLGMPAMPEKLKEQASHENARSYQTQNHAHSDAYMIATSCHGCMWEYHIKQMAIAHFNTTKR